MLWYLHVCADAGITVTGYVDNASGVMVEAADGSGHFKEVNLYPVVTVAADDMIEKANALHEKAGKLCFIASSVNFPVMHHPNCTADKKASV
jgi:organic hydroperoxide reductase OsmC/OhrA